MKIILIFAIAIFFLSPCIYGEFFFNESDHRLEVITIKGDKPGPTILIFGGIHGDEPGGHFSAEILSNIKMYKGTLLLVPRVNFPGIMMNKRELYGDMNRKFTDQENLTDPDLKVMRMLKRLIEKADILINQHDARGFHRKKYISKLYNPYCYGQSLIVDTGSFYSKKQNKIIDLEKLGKEIVKNANDRIANKKFHFCFWNHKSVDKATKFPEMKKTATHYALVNYKIPAFGVETSKDLPSLYHKVKYQLLVITKIMEQFGAEFHLPEIDLKKPSLFWVEFIKNDGEIIRVNNNTIVRLRQGDKIQVHKIYSNYIQGLSADILKWGSLNDQNKNYCFHHQATILIKKNNFHIGKIYFKPYLTDSIRKIEIQVNDKKIFIPNWGKISITKNGYFNIITTKPTLKQPRYDIRGFRSSEKPWCDSEIKVYPSMLIKKYSFNRKGKIYFVRIYSRSKLAGGFQIAISDRSPAEH